MTGATGPGRGPTTRPTPGVGRSTPPVPRSGATDTTTAAYVDRPGPAGTIRVGPLPAPEPTPTEVLVRVEASPVNRVDTFVRSGAFRTPLTFPFVIGRDLAGTVLRVGAAVTGFAPGDRVWCNSMGHAGRPGAAAGRVAVPADRLYPVPAGVDPLTAVAVAHPAATAYLGLVTHARVRPGETVLVIGAGGNVGSAAVTLARAAGARVVATAHPRDADHCAGLGAEPVVDYRDADWAAQVRRACPSGVDVVLDAAGVNDLTSTVGLLAPRGRVLVLAGLGTTPTLPAGELYLRDGAVLGFVISHATVAELADAARAINALLADGRLRARTVETLPLTAAAEAHRRAEDGLHGVRTLLLPTPP
ncbi:NADPH:quinone reductase [Micromonospora wenchangensis]|uniref:NADPH:quinone reductase n=1 Tax=Micromonospora wenchangensis TaxID=1185415 RepID=UPI001FE5438A|nr:NADPH:quinone reductase [Micromonospora wenchangensis]